MANPGLKLPVRRVSRLPAQRAGFEANVDSLLDRLVCQLWMTYCEMGRVSLH